MRNICIKFVEHRLTGKLILPRQRKHLLVDGLEQVSHPLYSADLVTASFLCSLKQKVPSKEEHFKIEDVKENMALK
jgi:hypothetical protein